MDEKAELSGDALGGNECVDKRQELFRRLHICRKLTNNADFHGWGNGLGDSFGGSLVMWFSDARVDGRPHTGARKAESASYLHQNAWDALVALANVAEAVVPYAWDRDRESPFSERLGAALSGSARKLLVGEAGAFVDRFGLPHMRADGMGPGTRTRPLPVRSLRFTRTFEADHAADMRRLWSGLAAPSAKGRAGVYRLELEARGLYVEGDSSETADRIFFDSLEPYAKDFSSCRGFEKERAALLVEADRLRGLEEEVRDRGGREGVRPDGSPDEAAFERLLAEEEELRNGRFRLHVERGALIQACERAFDDFAEGERASLERDGYVAPDVEALYHIGLLFRDALELYSAIKGDEGAFARVLPKVHMEVFDVVGAHAGDGPTSAAERAVAGRYTVWFESSGFDPDNPGSDLAPGTYETEVGGERVTFRRQPTAWGEQEDYGGGRAVHVLCEEGETPRDFRGVVRNHLGDFLRGMVDEGIRLNYKGRFAEPAVLDRMAPTVTVNDFGSDLVRTLWSAMAVLAEGIDGDRGPEGYSGKATLRLSRCKCCGRLIDTSHEAGHPREFCDASCRSLYRKRVKSEEKSGKEHAGMRLRREYLEYMGSEKAVRVGMSDHMGPGFAPDPASDDGKLSTLERIMRRLGEFPA